MKIPRVISQLSLNTGHVHELLSNKIELFLIRRSAQRKVYAIRVTGQFSFEKSFDEISRVLPQPTILDSNPLG